MLVKCECKTCSRKFDKKKSEIRKTINHFCSRSCAAKYNNRLRRKVKNCQQCNKSLRKGQKFYCSNTCYQDFILNQKVNDDNLSNKSAKRYLQKTNNCCSICGLLPEWNGKSLTMILDHIDGNSENNSLKNLRLVCHNCDSQLPTYKSKNKGNGRHVRRKRYREGKSY